MSHLRKCQELLCHQPWRQGQFLLQTGRKTLDNMKWTTSVTRHEVLEHYGGMQNLFISLKKKWWWFSMCCCVGEVSYFPPHHCFRECTKNAPPRVNYLGSHLSKLFPLISEEQYSSTWDLNQQQWNGAQSAPPSENKHRTDTEHHETTTNTGRCMFTWLEHRHAPRRALSPQQNLHHLHILYGSALRRQLGFLLSRELH